MVGLEDPEWATAQIQDMASTTTTKRDKGEARTTWKASLVHHLSATTQGPHKRRNIQQFPRPALRRQSTSQGPEAFNVFGGRPHPFRAASQRSSVSTTQEPPLGIARAANMERTLAAGQENQPIATSIPAPTQAIADDTPVEIVAVVLPLLPPPPPSDTTAAASEPRSQKGSFSGEKAQLIARMTQYKLERDTAVAEAHAWKAHARSLLLDRLEVVAPLLPLLEECRTIDAALRP